MTAKRLEEIKKKFNDNQGSIQDLGEVTTELFFSLSGHIKDLKKQLSEIQHNQEVLYNEIESMKDLMNPIYTIIQSDDLDSE